MSIVCAFLRVYLLVLFARAILSWFPPPSRGSALVPIQRVLYDVTEPLLAPLRRVIPPAGMFDISFMVLVFALLIVQRAVCIG